MGACVSAPGAAVAPETLGGQGSLAQRPGAQFSLSGRLFATSSVAVSLSIGADLVEVVRLPAAVNQAFAFATLLAPGDVYTVRAGDGTCQIRGSGGVVQQQDLGDLAVRCGASFKLASGAAASAVLGQPDMTSSAAGAGLAGLDHPQGLIRQQPSYVQVADSNNNRVLVYSVTSGNGVSTQPLQTTGQAVPTGRAPGLDASSFDQPTGLVSDGASLYVADRGNNRVLLYVPPPSDAKQSATYPLGQPDFTSQSPGCGPTAMKQPSAVFNADCHLMVADTGNNRVLI